MIGYLLINFISLMKLFLFLLLKIFLIPTLFSKYLIVIFCILILYLLYKYPRYNILIREDLFSYALKTKTARFYNGFILISYLTIFIIGIFTLRYSNINKKINLKEYYESAKKYFL